MQLHQFVCITPQRQINVAWLSIAKHGDVSFGLNDASLVLGGKVNPHFTYHPAAYFHLTQNGRANELFSGIGDLSIMLEQAPCVPWLELTTRPLADLPNRNAGRSGQSRKIAFFKSPSEDLSVHFKVDFLRLTHAEYPEEAAVEYFPSKLATVKISVCDKSPQAPAFQWWHES